MPSGWEGCHINPSLRAVNQEALLSDWAVPFISGHQEYQQVSVPGERPVNNQEIQIRILCSLASFGVSAEHSKNISKPAPSIQHRLCSSIVINPLNNGGLIYRHVHTNLLQCYTVQHFTHTPYTCSVGFSGNSVQPRNALNKTQ